MFLCSPPVDATPFTTKNCLVVVFATAAGAGLLARNADGAFNGGPASRLPGKPRTWSLAWVTKGGRVRWILVLLFIIVVVVMIALTPGTHRETLTADIRPQAMQVIRLGFNGVFA